MSAQAITTRNQGDNLSQTILKLKEGFEMKIATVTYKVNEWISSNLERKTPVRVLSILAIGAFLVTATVLTSGSAFADSPTRPVGLDAVSVELLGFSDGNRNEKAVLRSYASPIDFVDGTRVEKTMWRSYAAPIDFVEDYAKLDDHSSSILQSYAAPIDFIASR